MRFSCTAGAMLSARQDGDGAARAATPSVLVAVLPREGQASVEVDSRAKRASASAASRSKRASSAAGGAAGSTAVSGSLKYSVARYDPATPAASAASAQPVPLSFGKAALSTDGVPGPLS